MRPLQSEHLVWYLKRNFKDPIEIRTGQDGGQLLYLILIPLYALTHMKKFLKSGITAKICQTLGGISRKQIPKEEQVIKILDYLYLLQTQFRKTRMQQPPTLFKDSFLGLSVLYHPIIPLLVPLFLYIIPLTFGKWKLTSSDLFLLET